MTVDRELPNAALRLLFLSIEEVMGPDGAKAVLNGAKLAQYIDHYPPNNLEAQVRFSDYGRAEQAVENFYGPRGAKGILQRIGRATFHYGLQDQPTGLGLATQALKSMPLVSATAKMKLLLQQLVAAANKTVNLPQRLEENEDSFVVVSTECPCQYRPRHSQPCCFVTTGTLAEAARWLTGTSIEVQEITCLNEGADACRYRVPKGSRQ